MIHNFLLTDQVSTITTFITRVINQAGFALRLYGHHQQATERKNYRLMEMWEITLQNAPESTWAWVTQKRRGPVELFVGANFIWDLRRFQ
jgi:hypothetical protein